MAETDSKISGVLPSLEESAQGTVLWEESAQGTVLCVNLPGIVTGTANGQNIKDVTIIE